MCVEFATAAHERTLHSRADPLTQSQIRWSVRLHFHAHHRNDLLQLAQALLYAEQSAAAHQRVLGAAFTPTPAEGLTKTLAARTFAWTAVRPQPRARVIAEKLHKAAIVRGFLRKHELKPALVPVAPVMRVWPGTETLPRIETVQELAHWFGVDVPFLLWMADQGDRNRRQKTSALQHYSVRVLMKPSGGVRLVEAPKQHLRHLQREILREILDLVPTHDAVHGFRKERSITSFAEPHANRKIVLRLDLQEFFPSISGPRVQTMFRTLGYPEHVADLLGAICTTTTPDGVWKSVHEVLEPEEWQRLRVLYRRPHLPQGAPTSPALANLCALHMDVRLARFAGAADAVYTRYADDLAFSGEASFARSAKRFGLHVAAIVAQEGFGIHHHKTRLMRASVRQHLAGLTVNKGPNVSRREFDRLKAVLTNCVRHGAASQNRKEHDDFKAHLEGKVAFVAMVRPKRAAKLRALLERIVWP